MSTTDKSEHSYYFAADWDTIDANNTTYTMVNPEQKLSVVCDGEEIRITYRDLFRLLKMALQMWGDAE